MPGVGEREKFSVKSRQERATRSLQRLGSHCKNFDFNLEEIRGFKQRIDMI